MRKLLVAMLVLGLAVTAAPAMSQTPGEMLFNQGCAAFDLVDDLGSLLTPVGQQGRWLIKDLESGEELVFAFESVDLVPPPSEDPSKFSGTTFVAWALEETGIRGTNRTDFFGTIDLATFDATIFFEADTFRGNAFESGGGSGSGTANLLTGQLEYTAVRLVLCKAGVSGKK